MKTVFIILLSLSTTSAVASVKQENFKRTQAVKSCALQANYSMKSVRDSAEIWKNCSYCMERLASNEQNNIMNLMIKGCVRTAKRL